MEKLERPIPCKGMQRLFEWGGTVIENTTTDPASKSDVDVVNDACTLYELQFYRADNPPSKHTRLLCTDGVELALGHYRPHLSQPWRMDSALDVIDGIPWPGVKAWAELPDPNECMADCYPHRTCRVCGCTQDRACEGGCYWVEWDLCSKCSARAELSVKCEECKTVDLVLENEMLGKELKEARAEIERLKELNNKFKWQVRDTCKRAEKAESELVALKKKINEDQLEKEQA